MAVRDVQDLQLYRQYTREELAAGEGYTREQSRGGIWGTGVVPVGSSFFLFVTLDKSELDAEHQYDDGFEDDLTFRWQTQDRASHSNEFGRKHVDHKARGIDHHLFVRKVSREPFTYLGQVDLQSSLGDEPITITWRLRNAVPQELVRRFHVPEREERPEEAAAVERDTALTVAGDGQGFDKQQIVRVRREQAQLRNRLFGHRAQQTCCICGTLVPTTFLVAAHIKKRSVCTDEERRNVAVVAPMCVFGCDAMYERGLVTVEGGVIRTRSPHDATPALSNLLSRLDGRQCAAWSPATAPFFAWHHGLHRGLPG